MITRTRTTTAISKATTATLAAGTAKMLLTRVAHAAVEKSFTTLRGPHQRHCYRGLRSFSFPLHGRRILPLGRRPRQRRLLRPRTTEEARSRSFGPLLGGAFAGFPQRRALATPFTMVTTAPLVAMQLYRGLKAMQLQALKQECQLWPHQQRQRQHKHHRAYLLLLGKRNERPTKGALLHFKK